MKFLSKSCERGSWGLVVFIKVLVGCREAIYVEESTIDFPIFLLFFNTKFPIFPIFSILSLLFSYFSEQPCRWTPWNSPTDFKILSVRKLKTLLQKCKLELTSFKVAWVTSCVSIREFFKKNHDSWQPRKRRMEKGILIFSVSIVIISTGLLCQMQANCSGAESNNHIQVHEENEFCHCLFSDTPSKKHEIRHFHG